MVATGLRSCSVYVHRTHSGRRAGALDDERYADRREKGVERCELSRLCGSVGGEPFGAGMRIEQLLTAVSMGNLD
jgi:hypothetical protein